jgi:hypothetical protein
MKLARPALLALTAALFVAAAVGTASSARADMMTGYYPSKAHANFVVDYPSDWEVTPSEGDDEYVTLISPTGVILMFRTVGQAEEITDAVKSSFDYVKETYDNVTVSEPQDSVQKGLEGFFSTGTGTDKDGGGELNFAMAWYALPDGRVGEIWYVADKGDKEGAAAAAKILDSFRAP